MKLMLKLSRVFGFCIAILIFVSMTFLILKFTSKITANFFNYFIFVFFALIITIIYSILKSTNQNGTLFGELKHGFHDMGFYVTNIVNFVLLLLVYIIGVGLSFIWTKISKKSRLDMNLNSNKTYWKEYNLKKEKKSNYYRQF